MVGSRIGTDDDITSESGIITGAVTEPDPIVSNKAATEEAWQSRVQWSTLLVLKPVLMSFWNR